MPVMPQYTPGLGEALSDAFDTYRGVKRQKMFDTIAQQQGADAHQHAADEHTTSEIGNAVNFDFLPPGSPLRTGQVPPMAAPLPSAPVQSGSPSPSGDFEANLAKSFMAPGQDVAAATAEGGQAPQMVGQSSTHQLGRALMQSMAARGDKQAAPAPAAADPGAQFQQNMAATMGGNRVQLPGGGSVDPMAGFRRQVLLEQLKTGVATDAKIREAAATGMIDKNTAEAALARRSASRPQLGDTDYAPAMAQVAGAEAQARLGPDLQKAVAEGRISRENGAYLEGIRSNVQATLQKNQQDFENGKITREQRFQADKDANDKAASFFNNIAETDYRNRTSMTGRLFGSPPAPTVAPSAAVMRGQPSPSGADATPTDARTAKIDAMLKLGLSAAQIKAALAAGTP